MNRLRVAGAIALSTLVGCSSETKEDDQGRLNVDAGSGGSGSGGNGSGGSGGSSHGGGGNSGGGSGGSDGGHCTDPAAFQAFVAAHASCEKDSDCAVVGDCGPNADFTAVRADVADEAYLLMERRCNGGGWDGPTYDPICRTGKCDLVPQTWTCCGCPAIHDAGHDAQHDAGSD